MRGPECLITRHGGPLNLKSFKLAQLVYDITVRFCDRCMDHKSRIPDQMAQAARFGVQNIAKDRQVSDLPKNWAETEQCCPFQPGRTSPG